MIRTAIIYCYVVPITSTFKLYGKLEDLAVVSNDRKCITSSISCRLLGLSKITESPRIAMS